ncbi:ERC protein 2-like [Physella acuta]|uniref:ERC protein 2-like n=1 Tax=Physella acuta TaxID=109671 RepID=UPI0027DE0015|nr:ERC protein 2-like [Physella acuta]
MRLRVQVKYVTEHINYLEEKIHVLKPVVEALQGAVDKSKTWLEDKSDNESLTYCDLCQELESATLALLDKASHILGENKESVEDGKSFSSQSTSQTTATEERGRRQSTDQVLNELYKPSEILSRLEQIETAISSLQDVSRLEQIETAISSLQDVSRLEQIETAITSLQDVSRLEQIETAISSLQDVSRLEQIETAISSLQDVSRLEQIETAISSLQDVSRLEQIETAISSLQDANDKSTDDISEIKQWRDNFVTEQSDMGVNIKQLTKKQKQNFKNIRKQMSEQDNKVKELNKEIESLKEKETKSNKTLEKLSLDKKEYENEVRKINKEMQDIRDGIKQEIKSHSDLIVSLQDENNKLLAKTSTRFKNLQLKHSVMYKLLQQRLMPIDKLIQIFSQNMENREERLNTLGELENTISKLSNDFLLIESRVCNRYACFVQLASSTPIEVGVMAGGRWCTDIDVKCARNSTAGSVVVDMKKGEELFFQVIQADQSAALSCLSSFTILSVHSSIN